MGVIARILGGTTALFAILAGLFYGLWTLERARHENTKAEYAAFKTEIIDKTATAIAEERALRAEREKKSVEQATAADGRYSALMGNYQRVLREARSGDRPASPTGQDSGAGLPPNPSESASVSISADDAMICAANTAYATAAFEWAATLN